MDPQDIVTLQFTPAGLQYVLRLIRKRPIEECEELYDDLRAQLAERAKARTASARDAVKRHGDPAEPAAAAGTGE